MSDFEQQQSEQERYTASLEAYTDALAKGCSKSTLATMRFEMSLDVRDCIAIADAEIYRLTQKLKQEAA